MELITGLCLFFNVKMMITLRLKITLRIVKPLKMLLNVFMFIVRNSFSNHKKAEILDFFMVFNGFLTINIKKVRSVLSFGNSQSFFSILNIGF